MKDSRTAQFVPSRLGLRLEENADRKLGGIAPLAEGCLVRSFEGLLFVRASLEDSGRKLSLYGIDLRTVGQIERHEAFNGAVYFLELVQAMPPALEEAVLEAAAYDAFETKRPGVVEIEVFRPVELGGIDEVLTLEGRVPKPHEEERDIALVQLGGDLKDVLPAGAAAADEDLAQRHGLIRIDLVNPGDDGVGGVWLLAAGEPDGAKRRVRVEIAGLAIYLLCELQRFRYGGKVVALLFAAVEPKDFDINVLALGGGRRRGAFPLEQIVVHLLDGLDAHDVVDLIARIPNVPQLLVDMHGAGEGGVVDACHAEADWWFLFTQGGIELGIELTNPKQGLLHASDMLSALAVRDMGPRFVPACGAVFQPILSGLVDALGGKEA